MERLLHKNISQVLASHGLKEQHYKRIYQKVVWTRRLVEWLFILIAMQVTFWTFRMSPYLLVIVFLSSMVIYVLRYTRAILPIGLGVFLGVMVGYQTPWMVAFFYATFQLGVMMLVFNWLTPLIDKFQVQTLKLLNACLNFWRI